MSGGGRRELIECGRFAPSTTGPAHPGTLLSALLCWLDARSRGARVELRLEDLDPDRCRDEWARALPEALSVIGLEWDRVTLQSANAAEHARALDRLSELGLLYPCQCSRADLRAAGIRTPDGGWRYPNSCRHRSLPAGGWRTSDAPLRVRLPDEWVHPCDEGGLALSQVPSTLFGDPIVRRRDGAVAYHLASVVDDAASGVTRIVRGRDLAATSATQVALRRLLALPLPAYRHHLLLLEERGDKLAKLHGSVTVPEILRHTDGPSLCGVLAAAAGLLDRPEPVRPDELASGFDWRRVRAADQVMLWDGSSLRHRSTSSSEASPGTPTRSGKP